MKRALFAVCALLAAASVGGDQSAFGDYHADRPGARHRITVADLPAPYATGSASNSPGTVPRPAAAMPQAMPGYTVSLYADALENPRLMRTAPNGDIFVAESRPGRVKVLRGRDAAGRAQTTEVFASGLSRPFGIAFSPPGPNPTHVYVGNTDSVVRFPYRGGDLKARGGAETIAAVPTSTPPGRGHWSRDVVFSRDGKKMYVWSARSPTSTKKTRRTRKIARRSSSSIPTAAAAACTRPAFGIPSASRCTRRPGRSGSR